MVTHIIRNLLSGTKVIQTQEEDIADSLVASTPNVIAVHSAPTNASRAVSVKGPGGRIG